MWDTKNVDVVPVVVEAPGSVDKKLGKWIEKLGIMKIMKNIRDYEKLCYQEWPEF